MAIQVRWCAEATGILCWTIEGRWNWSHLRRALDEARALSESHDGRIDLIIDMREMGLTPANLTSGLKDLSAANFGFRAGGINVLVGMDNYLKLLWEALSKRLPSTWQVHFADTMAEAHEIIHKDRVGK